MKKIQIKSCSECPHKKEIEFEVGSKVGTVYLCELHYRNNRDKDDSKEIDSLFSWEDNGGKVWDQCPLMDD